MIFFKIIIPIYNVENYLENCLDSLLNQTFTSFFAVLVDDGSTDRSGKIAEHYSVSYPNLFKYIKQKNKGPGGARNTGLLFNCDSSYTIFLDSDDFYGPKVLQNLHDAATKNQPDCLLMLPTIYNMSSHSYYSWFDKNITEKIFKNGPLIEPAKKPEIYKTEINICRCAWKSDMLKKTNFLFIENTFWEDVPAHFFLLKNCKSVYYVGNAGTFYRVNSLNQITSSSGSSRLQIATVYKKTLEMAKEYNFSKCEKSYILFWFQTFFVWSIAIISDEFYEQFVNDSHKLSRLFQRRLYFLMLRKNKLPFKNILTMWFLRSNLLCKILRNRDTSIKLVMFYSKVKRRLFRK